MASYKYKEINNTIFYNKIATTIKTVTPGQIIYLKVKNPIGSKTHAYYGKISKISHSCHALKFMVFTN